MAVVTRFLLALALVSTPMANCHNVNRRAATITDKDNNDGKVPLLRSFEDFFKNPQWLNFKQEEPAGGEGGGGTPAPPPPPTTPPSTVNEGELPRTVPDKPAMPNKPDPSASAAMPVPNKPDQSEPEQPAAVPNHDPLNPSSPDAPVPNSSSDPNGSAGDEDARVERNAPLFYKQGPNTQRGQQLREQLQTGNSRFPPQSSYSNTRYPQRQQQQATPFRYSQQQRPNFFYPGQNLRYGKQGFSSGSTMASSNYPHNQKVPFVLRDQPGSYVEQSHPFWVANGQKSSPTRITTSQMTSHNSREPFNGSPPQGDQSFMQPMFQPSAPEQGFSTTLPYPPLDQQVSAFDAPRPDAVAAISNMELTHGNTYFAPTTTNTPATNYNEFPPDYGHGYPNVNVQGPSAPPTPYPIVSGYANFHRQGPSPSTTAPSYPNGAGNSFPDDLQAVESIEIPNKEPVPNKPAAFAL